MWMVVPDVAVLIAAAVVAAGHGSRPSGEMSQPGSPVIDARTDRELRARYLRGEIAIDVYLDRRFGTAFGSAGDRPRAG